MRPTRSRSRSASDIRNKGKKRAAATSRLPPLFCRALVAGNRKAPTFDGAISLLDRLINQPDYGLTIATALEMTASPAVVRATTKKVFVAAAVRATPDEV